MKLLTIAFSLAMAGAALADDAITYQAEGPFDDVSFAVENAIIGAGLVIDAQSHVGEMLARTKADVGGTKDLFDDAIVYTFCSAKLSRDMMEADLTNIQFCPYRIFVYATPDTPDEVTVGYQPYPGDSMAPVRDLLDGIVKDALMLE